MDQEDLQPNQPPQEPRAIGFTGRVMAFDTSDAITWFIHFECVMRIHGVPARDQFDYLVACLSKDALSPVAGLLRSPPVEERYEWLKQALIEAHGLTTRERLRKLLKGESIGDRKPSLFLSHLTEVAPEGVDEDIIKEVWWKELPTQCRTVLATLQGQPLTKLAAVADAVIEETRASHSIHAAGPSSEFQALRNEIELLRKEINDLKATNHNRGRPRSTSRGNNWRRREHSSGRPAGDERNPSTLCYKHRRFGAAAYQCHQPCSWPKNE